MRQRRSIPHVSWRNGRPRFQPSESLRKMGYQGEDLKVAGEWMTRGQATDWSNKFQKDLKRERRKRDSKGKPRGKTALLTIAQMFQDWQNPNINPKFKSKEQTSGKRIQKVLSPKTISDYRNKARSFEDHDHELFHSAVLSLDSQIVNGIFIELWEERGLSMAKGMIAVLRAAISWARLHYTELKDFDPFRGLRLETPEPRVRVASKAEFAKLVETADALGWPEIGDMFFLAVFTGQRQGDRLTMTYTALEERRKAVERELRQQLKQSKRGARVSFKFAKPLLDRLEQNKVRRNAANIESDFIILNEKTWQPFKDDFYRKRFSEMRIKAAKSPGCDSLNNFFEMDFRDTAVTWMSLGGSTLPEIVSVTGHSLQSASTVLQHYLARTPELADRAIDKLTAWYESDEDVAV